MTLQAFNHEKRDYWILTEDGLMQFYVLAGTGGVNAMNVNLQRSTFVPNVTYNSSIIVAIRNNQPSCTHFAPYVDLSTGELKAEVS